MRRYQLSGLEHVHMMRHVPRSYDMTRTHILHKSVNKHVDVVLRCSPKNWKKKKVTVSVVRGEKKNDAARIRANAKKGYVAVRKPVNDQFEADRKAAAAAIEAAAVEKKYDTRSPGSDALIHDMKSQISTMAKKSAEYIDSQLTEKPEYPYGSPMNPTVESKPEPEEKPVLSAETEDILKKGGYRLPGSKPEGSPYAADYLKHASNEEFHSLMDSLEKSLDEACKKYAVQPEEPETKTETETEPVPASESQGGKSEFGYEGYAGYSGGYNMPGDISLSVTKKQEIKPEEDEEEEEEFKPALTFTDGGEHYIPDSGRHYLREDDLFDRELNRPGETAYVPPAAFFEEEEVAPSGDVDDSEAYVALPEAIPLQPTIPKPQNIFYTEEDEQPFGEQEGYPREDYVQQQVFFTKHPDDDMSSHLYNPPQEEEEFAEPTMYHDFSGTHEHTGEESDDGAPVVFPDTDDSAPSSDRKVEYEEENSAPMIFPDEDEELPPPMIFPDEDEGYSPAPVSPDRNEYFDDGSGDQGVVNRSGQTLFSRTGDQIKKVIGVIRGSGDSNVNAGNSNPRIRNHNVEITYTDGKGKNI